MANILDMKAVQNVKMDDPLLMSPVNYPDAKSCRLGISINPVALMCQLNVFDCVFCVFPQVRRITTGYDL